MHGAWVWMLSRIAKGDPAKGVALARDLGLTRLLLKVTEDDRTFSANAKLAEGFVREAHAQGLDVYGWGYLDDVDPKANGLTLADRVTALGLTGAIANTEKEYTDDHRHDASAMRALLSALVGALPAGFPIGVSSFRQPTFFPDGPWNVLREFPVAGMPQCYFNKSAASGRARVRRSMMEWAALGTSTVRMSLGSWYHPDITPTGMKGAAVEVLRLAAGGICEPAYDWWSLQHIERDMGRSGKAVRQASALTVPTGVDPLLIPLRDPDVKAKRSSKHAWWQKAGLLRLGYFNGQLAGGWGSRSTVDDAGSARNALVRFQADSADYTGKLDGVWGDMSEAAVAAALEAAPAPPVTQAVAYRIELEPVGDDLTGQLLHVASGAVSHQVALHPVGDGHWEGVVTAGPQEGLADRVADELRRAERERLLAELNVDPPELAEAPPTTPPVEVSSTPYADALRFAIREWHRDVREPPGTGWERIDAYVRGALGLGWAWEKPYKRNGQFAWCGAFASFAYGQAGIAATIRQKHFASCFRLWRWSADTPRRVDWKSGDIRPGDIVIVGHKGSKRWGSHITICDSFDAAAAVVHTVEGNARGTGPDGARFEGVIRQDRSLPKPGLSSRSYRVMHVVRPLPDDFA